MFTMEMEPKIYLKMTHPSYFCPPIKLEFSLEHDMFMKPALTKEKELS